MVWAREEVKTGFQSTGWSGCILLAVARTTVQNANKFSFHTSDSWTKPWRHVEVQNRLSQVLSALHWLWLDCNLNAFYLLQQLNCCCQLLNSHSRQSTSKVCHSPILPCALHKQQIPKLKLPYVDLTRAAHFLWLLAQFKLARDWYCTCDDYLDTS